MYKIIIELNDKELYDALVSALDFYKFNKGHADFSLTHSPGYNEGEEFLQGRLGTFSLSSFHMQLTTYVTYRYGCRIRTYLPYCFGGDLEIIFT